MPFFLLFISIAATNLVAKSHRKDDNIGSARIARTTVTMGGLGGALLCVVTVLAARALSTLYCGSNAAVLAPLCAKYVLVRALALPAVVVATVAQGLCIGIKDTKTPMLAVAVSAALNFFGDLLFVGGLSMGIAGAAWATTISQYCAAVLLLRVLAGRGLLTPPATITKRAATAATPARSAAPQTTPATIRAVLSFLPFLFVMSVKVSMHNACSATAATLGGAAAAAHTALMAVAWLCFTFGDVGSSLAQAYLPAFASEAAEAKPEEAPPSAPASGDGTSGEGTATSELLQYVYPDGVAAAEGGGTAPSAPATKPLGRPTFDMVAAWPTIAQLLRCTLTISATVIAMATLLLSVFAGQISSDVECSGRCVRLAPGSWYPLDTRDGGDPRRPSPRAEELSWPRPHIRGRRALGRRAARTGTHVGRRPVGRLGSVWMVLRLPRRRLQRLWRAPGSEKSKSTHQYPVASRGRYRNLTAYGVHSMYKFM